MREAIFGRGHGLSGVQPSGQPSGQPGDRFGASSLDGSSRGFKRRRGQPAGCGTPDGAGVAQGEGLLHDARNLLSALGLYSDLLSVPGVLKPEHRHYAEELRLMGSRSGALMERLVLCSSGMASPPSGRSSGLACERERTARSSAAVCVEAGGACCRGGTGAARSGAGADHAGADQAGAGPVSVRSIVERCSGLLGRVAEGRTIEVSYGPAASVPVLVDEEAIERILVNLVHNSAAALDRSAARVSPLRSVPGNRRSGDSAGRIARTGVRESLKDATADETPGAIRIGVGLLVDRVGGPSPWPFRWVRLTVEDSGCGMGPEQLERLLESGGVAARGRGIGFRVVRELVAAGDGDLRVMSASGVGTRVQIEWPVAAWTGAQGGPLGTWAAGASGPPGPRRLEPASPAVEAGGAGSTAAGDGRWTA